MKNLKLFIEKSPTAYQATESIAEQLKKYGFNQLFEKAPWVLLPGEGYYVIRNMSSVIAFRVGTKNIRHSGFRIVGAHTDSPSLKLKTDGGSWKEGSARVSTEVYGGPVVSSWLDRELSVAGVVNIKKDNWSRILFNYKKPIAIVPNLAIHMNRDINKGYEYNKQNHLQAILGISKSDKDPLRSMVSGHLHLDPSDIGEMDLFLYDPTAGSFLGDEYFVSPRIDNLAMCHCILTSLTASVPAAFTQMGVFFDNEEIGNLTYQGADSTYLSEILERIVLASGGTSREDYFIAKAASFLISADGAHGVHPNFSDKHDPDYLSRLNGGPVIKFNAGYKYSTTSETSEVFRQLCEELSVPVQSFVGRSDMPSGSTIGAISSSILGIKAVDVGNPMWAMHSIRETYGMKDHVFMKKVLTYYFNEGIKNYGQY